MTIAEKTIQVGDLNWFYREAVPQGDRGLPPVLLLHGLPTHSYTWCGVMSLLAEMGLRAIAPDWIGSGFSSKPDRREFAYTPAAYLNALGGFVDALELETLSIAVQGFLASVGIQYAQANSDRVDRLIVLNTPLSASDKLPWKMQQWGIPFVGDMMTQDPLLVDRTLEAGSGFVISDNDLSVHRQPYLKSSSVGRALLATTQKLDLAQVGSSIEAGWQNWQKPTLILWGAADPWLTGDRARSLAQEYPNVEFTSLEEAKHYPQEHWTADVGNAIGAFLRRQSS